MNPVGFNPGKITAVALCLALLVFMTAEASHSHDHSQSQGHTACAWCAMAHVATVPTVDFSPATPTPQGEVVDTQEPTHRQPFVIFLHRIRPPPIPQLKDKQK